MSFCENYLGDLFKNDWRILEDEFGLNFIEVMTGETSDLVPNPLRWKDMVQTTGEFGLCAPDAMIINLFVQSTCSLLVTTDQDFKQHVALSGGKASDEKALLVLS